MEKQTHNQKQIWLNLKQWNDLNAISKKTDGPIAALLRRAVEAYLNKEGER